MSVALRVPLAVAAILLAGTLSSRPAAAATITVNDTGDAISVNAKVTLREAIASIDAGADVNADVTAARTGSYGTSDAIHFAIGSGVKTISPASPLPFISKTMTIDGSTQPGFAGAPLITLDGSAVRGYGLVISSSSSSSVVAVIVQNFAADGILVSAGLPGDVNGDGVSNVADVFYLINTLFAGGPAPLGPADANGDGKVDVSDVFYLINFLFAGGPTPV